MRYAIMGGTFDPIHLGHLVMAQCAAEQLQLDKVFFLPNGNPPHKDDVGADKYQRLEMVRLAAAGNPLFAVSDYEVQKQEACYTADTVRHFSKLGRPILIVGADALRDLPGWYQFDQYKTLCDFAAFRRDAAGDIAPYVQKMRDLGCNVQLLAMPAMEIASTELRRRVRQGKDIRYFTTDAVAAYIQNQGLYR